MTATVWPFPATIKKTGKYSLGITIPPTLRNKIILGKAYKFTIDLEEQDDENLQ